MSATNSPDLAQVNVMQYFDFNRRPNVVAFANIIEANKDLSSATDRHHRIEFRGTERRHRCSGNPGRGGQQHGSDEQRRLDNQRKQLAAVGLAHIGMPEHHEQTAYGAPTIDPEAPSSPPCSRNTRRIWPCDDPMARNMPISFDR